MPKSAEQCEAIREKMRKRILDSSLIYFAKHGYSGTKISDLAKFIGIGQGTFYSYFSSKEDMFKQIFNMETDSNRENLIKLQNAPLSAAEKIILLSGHMIEAIKNDSPMIYMFALNIQIGKEESFENSFAKAYEETPDNILSRIIAHGQQEGTVVDGNPDELADFYWSMIHTIAIKKVFNNQHKIFEARWLARLLLKD